MRRLACAVLTSSVLAGSAAATEVGWYATPAMHGDHIVFASEGDLWTVRVPQGETGPFVAHRLTSGDGDESNPVFSPDGSQIAFAADYDGNTDVYVMPAEGGTPQRMTFHPAPDTPVAWTPEQRTILFTSGRRHAFGRTELWRVPSRGGPVARYDVGEVAHLAMSASGRRIAFARWGTSHWSWKRYRGGTAPEIWVGELAVGRFTQVTDDAASDQHPLFLLGRVFFTSDRSGVVNIWSARADGGDVKQHTFFAHDDDDPTSVEGYDARWPSADGERGGTRAVFCQAGDLLILDARDDALTRLDVRLASDRLASRTRYSDPMEKLTGVAISHDGARLTLASRGDLITVDIPTGVARQATETGGVREWGPAFLTDERILCVTDQTGEQQLGLYEMGVDRGVVLVTQDREDWLFPPIVAPQGNWIAFADKTMRVHAIDLETLEHRQVATGNAGEITDYRFSPDGQWLAWSQPTSSGYSAIMIHSLRTQRTFRVSSPMHDDHEPRWDPAGNYLYFLSNRHFDPMMGAFDMEHVYLGSTVLVAVPLNAADPPPIPDIANAAGFDLDEWATWVAPPPNRAPTADEPLVDGLDAAQDGIVRMRVDTESIISRQYVLALPPGSWGGLEALPGAVLLMQQPTRGLLHDDWMDQGPDTSSTIMRYDIVDESLAPAIENAAGYVVSADKTTIAWVGAEGIMVAPIAAIEAAEPVDLTGLRLRTDVRAEWTQIFDEAWRLQRDFYWDPNMAGVDWDAIREKYTALLPRVGTREELNDLIGRMIGELATSHAYIFGGEPHDRARGVSVGLLGADVDFVDGGHRVTRILPGAAWDPGSRSPLAAPHLGVTEGEVITAVDGVTLTPASNIHAMLQDRAGRPVRLSIAAAPDGRGARDVVITALGDDTQLRYDAWVEGNRRRVEEASEGALGYIHIPDMGGEGLRAFSRQFFPQVEKRGLVVDVRNNGGGFVSQMILQRLARKLQAFDQPRHGATGRYPARVVHGHLAALIDQHAGSDGDIFPAMFRKMGLGPLIGTRTWGGVVGIRGDKPFVDMGISTQPEFAWWDETYGWALENGGVAPDIEVPLTPSDRRNGRDPQLERGIEHLMEALGREPMELPDAPPYPDRSGG